MECYRQVLYFSDETTRCHLTQITSRDSRALNQLTPSLIDRAYFHILSIPQLCNIFPVNQAYIHGQNMMLEQ